MQVLAELAKNSDKAAKRSPKAANNVDISISREHHRTPIVNAQLREQNIEQLLREVQATDANLGSSNPVDR